MDNFIYFFRQAVAQEYLKKHKWKVDTAVDDYFNKTGGSLATQKTKGNVDMYEKYKAIGIKEGGDASIDAIQGEGVVSFAKDLGFDVTDIMTMVICWKLRAKAGFMMPRDDLIGALSDLKYVTTNSKILIIMCRLDGFSAIKGKVNSWKSELDNAATYKQFYNFCFEFSLQPPAKTIRTNKLTINAPCSLRSRHTHLEIALGQEVQAHWLVVTICGKELWKGHSQRLVATIL